MGRLTINGKTCNDSPDESLVINRAARFRADNINGLLTTDITINGLARPPVPSGCVLYAPLWHPALGGATFKTLDKNAHTGTATLPLWTPQGRKFDLIDDYITFGDLAALTGLTAFTAIAWVKPTSIPATEQKVVAKWRSAKFTFLLTITATTGEVQTAAYGWGSGGTTTLYAVAGDWQCIMGKWSSGTSCKVGLNGAVQTGTLGGTPTVGSTDAAVVIGSRSDLAAHFFGGSIGEVLVFNREITDAEYLAYYQATKWRY